MVLRVAVERKQTLLLIVAFNANLPALNLANCFLLSCYHTRFLSGQRLEISAIVLVTVVIESFLTMLLFFILIRGSDIGVVLALVRPKDKEVAQTWDDIGQECGAEAADQLVEQAQVGDKDAADKDRDKERQGGEDVLRVGGEGVGVFVAQNFVQSCTGWVELCRYMKKVRSQGDLSVTTGLFF